MFTWIVIIAIVLGILFLLDREIYKYEGIHIGSRLQAFLYDRWAEKYDHGKQAGQLQDVEMLARPLLEKLSAIPAPFVLDVATGTGRLPFALLSQPDFKGSIIAIDISHGMLERAAKKLEPHREHVRLMQYDAFPLPFPDETFDVVCCMEALELIGEKQAAVKELARVLRPGGTLLTSRGTEESGRGIVVISAEALTELLHNAGLEDVQITPWWRVFNRVLAHKPGTLIPAGLRKVGEVLVCPSCGGVGTFTELNSSLTCKACNKSIKLDADGILNYR
ncbi:MAG: class I SAM-dependent methyltransferase [Chloroflexi bacterium]|nr:class I SAM-dependent methyltransferase [Chloroflexota bacterium]